MSFINTRVVQVDLRGVETQLKRIADAMELALSIGKPEAIPYKDFDPDDFSAVIYTNEEDELIQEKLARRIAGVDLGL